MRVCLRFLAMNQTGTTTGSRFNRSNRRIRSGLVLICWYIYIKGCRELRCFKTRIGTFIPESRLNLTKYLYSEKWKLPPTETLQSTNWYIYSRVSVLMEQNIDFYQKIMKSLGKRVPQYLQPVSKATTEQEKKEEGDRLIKEFSVYFDASSKIFQYGSILDKVILTETYLETLESYITDFLKKLNDSIYSPSFLTNVCSWWKDYNQVANFLFRFYAFFHYAFPREDCLSVMAINVFREMFFENIFHISCDFIVNMMAGNPEMSVEGIPSFKLFEGLCKIMGESFSDKLKLIIDMQRSSFQPQSSGKHLSRSGTKNLSGRMFSMQYGVGASSYFRPWGPMRADYRQRLRRYVGTGKVEGA